MFRISLRWNERHGFRYYAMNCIWTFDKIEDDDYWRLAVCKICGKRLKVLTESGDNVVSPCRSPVPRAEPGKKLRHNLKKIGAKETSSCQCAKMQRKMDQWGPDGCRSPDNRSEILSHLRKAYDESFLLNKMKCGAFAFFFGFPMSLEGLLDLSIKQSEDELTALLNSGS
jgi:hypothetical protein